MDEQPDTIGQEAPQAPQAVGAGVEARPRRRLPRLALPGRLVSLKKARPALPKFHRPRLGRIEMADVVLAAGASSLVLSVVFVLTGPARLEAANRDREATIRTNAATLQLAAETFAAGHQGRYPVDVEELFPYLPAGEAPLNPYTGDRTLFRGSAGDLTYCSRTGEQYVIEAWGPGPARPLRLVSLHGRIQGKASGESH